MFNFAVVFLATDTPTQHSHTLKDECVVIVKDTPHFNNYLNDLTHCDWTLTHNIMFYTIHRTGWNPDIALHSTSRGFVKTKMNV